MKLLFELLDGFGLTATDRLSERLKEWGDEQFQRFFDQYQLLAASRPLLLTTERGFTDIYPDSAAEPTPIEVIRQLCIYVNHFYIHDPILELAYDFAELDSNVGRLIGAHTHDQRLAEFRGDVESVIGDMIALRPLAESGVLHFTPTPLIRSRREPGAIYATDLFGPKGRLGKEGKIEEPRLELLPGLAEYVNEHLAVNPVRIEGGRTLIDLGGIDKPTRSIAVHFDDRELPRSFFLSVVRPKGKSDDGGLAIEMTYAFDGSNEELDDDTFRNWVVGESQRYVMERLHTLQTDLQLAAAAGAHFLTPIPSTQALATLNLSGRSTASPVVQSLLSLDLPYLADVSLKELAAARRDESAFQEFRVAMDKAFKELYSLEEEKRSQRVDEIIQDLIHAPLSKIDKRLRTLNRQTFLDAALLLGTLSATIATGNTLLGVAFIAAGVKAYDDYKKDKAELQKISENPSMFYWKATKQARKRAKTTT